MITIDMLLSHAQFIEALIIDNVHRLYPGGHRILITTMRWDGFKGVNTTPRSTFTVHLKIMPSDYVISDIAPSIITAADLIKVKLFIELKVRVNKRNGKHAFRVINLNRTKRNRKPLFVILGDDQYICDQYTKYKLINN